MFAILICAQQMTFARTLASAGLAKRRRIIDDVLFGNIDGIAVNGVDQAVRPQRQVVSAMTNVARKLTQRLHFVEAVIAIGISQAIKPFGIVGVGVKRVVG